MRRLITHAASRPEIARCHAVMVQLRPHLTEEAFTEQVLRQQQAGYRLAVLEEEGAVRALAGYRITENLVYGKFCYVDDLVTDAAARSLGAGRELFDWLAAQAREAGCRALHLDSGVQRFDAHRFYLARRMKISAHHFGLALD